MCPACVCAWSPPIRGLLIRPTALPQSDDPEPELVSDDEEEEEGEEEEEEDDEEFFFPPNFERVSVRGRRLYARPFLVPFPPGACTAPSKDGRKGGKEPAL